MVAVLFIFVPANSEFPVAFFTAPAPRIMASARLFEHSTPPRALTEQNEEWLLQHSMAEIDQAVETEVIDALPLSA
jgi:hypothetical protein